MKRIIIGYLIDGKNSGIDSYIINVIQQIKTNEIIIDCLTNHIDGELQSRLQRVGVGLIEIPALKHPLKQMWLMKKIILQGQYDIAYFNISEAFNCLGIWVAYICNVKKIVVHSHSSGVNSHSKVVRGIRKFCHYIMKNLVVCRCADEFYTCSYKAGKWMFSNKILQGKHFHIMNNAVDVSKFSYNPIVRKKKRKELGIQERIVIGQIGAFSYQKNPEYVIEIAQELYKRNPQNIVLMIGSGRDFDKIQRLIKERHLEKAVQLLGTRKDVNELVQAMDIFVLPSRFEGLPIVAIEAQVAGLKVFLSNTISKESALSERCNFLPVDVSAEKWADAICSALPYDREALDLSNCTYCFDIENQNEQIREIFL